VVVAAWVALAVCAATVVVSGQTGDTPAEREARVREQLAAAEELYCEGKAAAAFDAYAEARRLSQGRVPLADEHGRAILGMADSLRLLGQAAEAKNHYLEADTGRAAPDALLRAGQVSQWELDDPAEARSLYERVAAEHPNSSQARLAELRAAATLEYEGRFDDALRAYDALTLKYATDPGAAAVVEKAQEAIRFIKIHRGEDDAPLAIYRRSERLARRESTRNTALLELISLTGRYAESPLVDDALVLMMRTYLAKGDRRAARETFDRLVKVGPRDLEADAARLVAIHAAGWLLSDVDAQIQRVAEVFPELAAYGRSEQGWRIPSMVVRNADDQWMLIYDSGAGNSARRLSLRIVVGPATPEKTAVYPALGFLQEVSVETSNEILRQEIAGGVRTMTDVLKQLDRAAYVREGPAVADVGAAAAGAGGSRR
jgi:tetratricopeptide (TPR) repeat protein